MYVPTSYASYFTNRSCFLDYNLTKMRWKAKAYEYKIRLAIRLALACMIYTKKLVMKVSTVEILNCIDFMFARYSIR